MSNNIVLATDSDREHLMTLYKEQVGREFCAWDEDYPSTETIDFDLSKPNGRSIVTTLNGSTPDYMQPIKEGDKIEVYWK